MRRLSCAMLILCLASLPVRAQQTSAAQKQATLAYLYALQKDNGGFAVNRQVETPGTLTGTSSGLRAIKYFGGEVKHKDACAQFIRSCRDAGSGGFAASPGGKPDVRTTAIGIMAAKEAGVRFDDDFNRAIAYLATNAQSFEDRRIAAAAFEASALPEQGVVQKWVLDMLTQASADGTFGQGGNVARDTGSAVVTLLRLGGMTINAEPTLKVLQAGQREDGGWGKDGEKSDMETTYRVMRAFVMLKGKPDLAKCQAFVARCRNEDGGYGLQPGQPSAINATYFAGIVGHWIEGMAGK